MKLLKSLLRITLGLGVALSFMVFAVWLYDIYRRPQMVADILNIPSPPSSLRVIECESLFTTDVLTTCAVEVAPEQFPELLRGYSFQGQVVHGPSHFVVGQDVGSAFEVTQAYVVQPSEFVHGGFVSVFTNSERRQAIVDLYIE